MSNRFSPCEMAKELAPISAESILNEAKKRFSAIPRIISDVLGGPDTLVTTEEHANLGCIDFSLRSSGDEIVLVIEAKKAGAVFEVAAPRRNAHA